MVKFSTDVLDDICWVPFSRIELQGHGASSYNLPDVKFCNIIKFWEDSKN